MTKESFVSNFFQLSKEENFTFLSLDKTINNPARMSATKQSLLAGVMGGAMSAVFGGGAITGAFFGSGLGYSENDRTALQNDMIRMSEYCELVGIKLDTGACILRLLVDADELSGQTLIGRFAMIHDLCAEFRRYSMVIAKHALMGSKTSGTSAQVLTLFSSHKQAREFKTIYADKCSHKSSGGIFTSAWVVDLEDEEVVSFQPKVLGFIPIIGGLTDKHRLGLFKITRSK